MSDMPWWGTVLVSVGSLYVGSAFTLQRQRDDQRHTRKVALFQVRIEELRGIATSYRTLDAEIADFDRIASKFREGKGTASLMNGLEAAYDAVKVGASQQPSLVAVQDDLRMLALHYFTVASQYGQAIWDSTASKEPVDPALVEQYRSSASCLEDWIRQEVAEFEAEPKNIFTDYY